MSEILVCGEAWGEQEEEARQAFVGKSGFFIKQCFAQAGIDWSSCYITNVFNLRPKPSNDVSNLCGPKTEGIPGMPALIKGKFVRREYLSELTRLYQEINDVNPNVIIALGGTAAWALLGSTGIKNIRGAGALTSVPSLRRPFKILPTYHPAAVLREYSLRPILLADLDKARRYSTTPELVRPSREIWIEPDLMDLAAFERKHLTGAKRLSIDIETKGDQITCIGFAPSESAAIVIPFWSDLRPRHSYWPTESEEIMALGYVRRWCEEYESVFQNGLYDMHRIWRQWGIRCRGNTDDTMLLHHSLQPEMEKGLGFLGSIYTDEASWKFMRKAVETGKKEN